MTKAELIEENKQLRKDFDLVSRAAGRLHERLGEIATDRDRLKAELAEARQRIDLDHGRLDSLGQKLKARSIETDHLKAENERLRCEKVRAFLEGREDGLKSAKAECCATVVMLGGRYEAGAERCFGAIDNKLAEARAALKGDDDDIHRG